MTLAQLHDKHGDYLLKCLRVYGVPKQECEDVRQDLYLKLLEKKTDLTKITYEKGFCSRITRNAAFNWLRKTRRASTIGNLCVPILIAGEGGAETVRPEMDALATARWQAVVDNPNTERIAQALELAQLYECQPETTAYEVIADLLYGLTLEQIGRKHDVGRMTISRWMQDWHKWINEKLNEGASSV